MFVVTFVRCSIPHYIIYLKTSCVTQYHPVYCTLPTVGSKTLFPCCAHTILLHSHMTLYRSTVTFMNEVRKGEREEEENKKNSEKRFRFLHIRDFIILLLLFVFL